LLGRIGVPPTAITARREEMVVVKEQGIQELELD